MFETVYVAPHSLAPYKHSAGAAVVSEIRALAEPLRGARVLHVNATSFGGGVAEILRTEIPLLRDLGLDAEWKTVVAETEFYEITKAIHNGLQGSERGITRAERKTYLRHAEKHAETLTGEYDLIIVHDPQVLPLLKFHGKRSSKWIWRCHIDTSNPNPELWTFLLPLLEGYDATIFTLADYVPDGMPIERIEIVPPAIDPESPKNIDLGIGLAQKVLTWLGVHTDSPLIAQVSRFDPWKDPLGVIAAYRIAKRTVPDLQLALVGSLAQDDPEGFEIYEEVQRAAKAEAGIHVFTNLTGAGNIEVNAFQRSSAVVIQKSIREGFGLTVAEALWKGTPVVAGNVGGIPLQMEAGAGGFLVESPEECAEKTLWLLEHPTEAAVLGVRGRELVRQRFLITRLIADELRLYRSLLD